MALGEGRGEDQEEGTKMVAALVLEKAKSTSKIEIKRGLRTLA